MTRDSVLGLEVVLAGGRVLRTGRRTIKGVTGYDLTGLFVGSEGTLGVITSATLRLRPRPAQYPVTVAAGFPSVAAGREAVTAIMRGQDGPSLLELMDSATLRAIDDWKSTGFGDSVQALLIAQDDSESAERGGQLMQRDLPGARRASWPRCRSPRPSRGSCSTCAGSSYPAIERLGVPLVEDVCVPRSRLPDMVARIEQAAERHGVLDCDSRARR